MKGLIVSVKFQNITYSNNRDMMDLLQVCYKKVANDVMNSIVLHFLC